ncbi:MSCRAMM family adhesin SdrC, partial [Candidatus Solirubrobacter pratensis]|uniref:MSCRAMM family adhesin SdrC n=1 Tax=Candidatus Solirubrobacter pratensis TaxID=1298857 RepID=UPI001E2F6DF7
MLTDVGDGVRSGAAAAGGADALGVGWDLPVRRAGDVCVLLRRAFEHDGDDRCGGRDADADSHGDADRHADRDADRHADRDADGDADRDAHGDADRDAHGDADRDA